MTAFSRHQPQLAPVPATMDLAAFHAAPTDQEILQVADALIATAEALARLAPQSAAAHKAAPAIVRRAVREGLAPSPETAAPESPPPSAPARLHYPSDIERARTEAALWMHDFAAQWPADRDAPSGREILRRKEKEALPWPEWILFEARNRQWPTAKPLKVDYPNGVRR